MAFQINPVPVPVEINPRKTHLLIQSIIDNKLKEFERLVEGIDINALYSSEIWKDDVSLLTAAVLCGNDEICNFLLGEKKADPNMVSTNGLTALHYAANTPRVPLNVVRRLIAAKANPDGHQQQSLTPLQHAAKKDRLEVFEQLLESGADPGRNYGVTPDLDQKVEHLFNKLAANNEAVEKCRIFFEFAAMVSRKTEPEVFSIYKDNFLEEHPFTHLVLFEGYFNVAGPSAELYQLSSTKWLKDFKKTDIYIEGFIERFPRIPNKHRILALNSLHAVLCMIREIPLQTFNAIVPLLFKCLLQSSTVQANVFNPLILSTLCVTMDRSSKQKPAADSLYSDVLTELCSTLVPFIDSNCPLDVSILIYCLFAALHEFVPEHINLCGLTSVPERVLLAVDIETDFVIKEKLKKLDRHLRSPQSSETVETLCDAADMMPSKKKKKKKKKKKDKHTNSKDDLNTAKTSVEELDSNAHSYAAHSDWCPISKRWRSKLEKLFSLRGSEVYQLGDFTIGISSEFMMAKGCEGTQVFLGLTDDGTEVAVKRMHRSKYQELKHEQQIFRIFQHNHSCIVHCVNFKADANFAYLIFELCEYTLEEYIQNHLPEDTSQKKRVLKKLVNGVLYSLNVLHRDDVNVLHRNLQPQNVLIDRTGTVKLAGFSKSQRLKLGETTCCTSPAGTKCWKARETLGNSNGGYKRSSDVQVAGMLVYYILSCGHHPFGSSPQCEHNIHDGKYTLEHLEDELAKDLVEWMISHEPKDRPNVKDTLYHPFHWTDKCKVAYLEELGKEKDVVNCRTADPVLLSAIKDITAGKSFSSWKTKLPSKLVQKLKRKIKSYPENILGLLRFIRILHMYYYEDAKNLDLLTLFPDLFENAFKFAKERGWITTKENLLVMTTERERFGWDNSILLNEQPL